MLADRRPYSCPILIKIRQTLTRLSDMKLNDSPFDGSVVVTWVQTEDKQCDANGRIVATFRCERAEIKLRYENKQYSTL
jgi:hypothetical protein